MTSSARTRSRPTLRQVRDTWWTTAVRPRFLLVVADGRITEAGSHDELMAADGLYAELYAMQAAAYR